MKKDPIVGWKAYRYGLIAESVAGILLRLKWYKILTRRFRTRGGEIDIIATRGNTIAFVEVKGRQKLEEGLDAVSFTAWRRISVAAEAYMASHPEYACYQWRYDLIIVSPFFRCSHIMDVFRPFR